MAYQAYTKTLHDIFFAILYLIKDNAIRVVKLQKKKKKKKKKEPIQNQQLTYVCSKKHFSEKSISDLMSNF